MNSRLSRLRFILFVLALGGAASVSILLQRLPPIVSTIVLFFVLSFFLFFVLSILQSIWFARRNNRRRQWTSRPFQNGGDSTGVREPRHPKLPSSPPQTASVDVEDSH